uniref:DNA-directed RNA polymerase III subunit RPC3 n=1 Tax=Saccoglossus kowalevskii TaxID=10224 RepID=A0ABM0MUT3_SACKO|nr:PREDICTED: DNA-directed RNA polymerase III subunit RPC3-like [Saccoglossus kowalevskii]
MSNIQIRLASLLLRENYGEIVEKVGSYLIKYGLKALRAIALDTNLKLDQVRKALCVLITHNMAKFTSTKRGIIYYQVSVKTVLLLSRYPRYIYSVKTLYGDAGELIVEEILQNGQLLMSKVVRKVTERLNEALEDRTVEESFVRDKFIDLVSTHFLQRVVNPPSDIDSTVTESETAIEEEDLYKIPEAMKIEGCISRKRRRSEDEDRGTKRIRTDSTASEDPSESFPDDGVYWHTNFDRFHQHLRDQAIIDAVSRRVDKIGAEIVRTMLRMSELTTDPKATLTKPMSSHEIFHALSRELNIPRPTLDQYLKLLADDQIDFINKTGESGGGIYVINIYKAIKSLCIAHIESVVQERFGSKCYRIFRLLLLKQHLEQKQVEEFAMIPAKEAKELLYQMFSEHFVSVQEIPRTPDHAPSRTFYLFSVNLNQVCRMLLERCYKTNANLIARREHDTYENRRLLERSQRIEAVVAASLRNNDGNPEQTAELEEMITPPERAQLNKLKHNVNK